MLIAKIGSLKSPVTASGFITEWQVSGDATARTITLPLVETRAEGALSYNCTVDWGDGSGTSTVTAFDDVDRIHTYASDGTYEVTITGTCEGWSFNNAGDKLKITKVINFGEIGAFDGFKYLKSGFLGCANLTSIGTSPIPASGTGILTDGFYFIFYLCSSLIEIPSGLFDLHTNVTTNAFYAAFRDCSTITSIPADLFKYNTAASSNGFRNIFWGCSELLTVPEDLFRYNISVETTGFNSAFRNCYKLQLNSNIFCDEATEKTTRFLNQSVDFTTIFQLGAAFTGTQGTAPTLWDYTYGTGTPVTTNCFTGHSTSSVDNYADIPTAWGGA